MKSILTLILACSISFSCSRQIARIDPAEPTDLSGRWNDTDSRKVADKMMNELTASQTFKAYAAMKGRKPVIVIGQIKNKTSEHIDAANYIKKMEVAIFNSDLADLVESEEFRDKLRLERAQQQDFADPATMAAWGKETGADLILFGEMTSETDVAGKTRIVNYITTLFLTDMETNKRIWYGQEEIKKLIRN